MNTGFYVQAFLRHPVFQGISASMHVNERYAAVTRMWKSSDVQAFLRHPVFQCISASMHVNERYAAITRMWKSSDVQSYSGILFTTK